MLGPFRPLSHRVGNSLQSCLIVPVISAARAVTDNMNQIETTAKLESRRFGLWKMDCHAVELLYLSSVRRCAYFPL